MVFAVPPVLRAVTDAMLPKLRVRLGAVVINSVDDDVPMLPDAVVRFRVPVELVVIVNGPPAPETILPELVDKLTVCIVELPRFPLTVIPLEPNELFMIRLETAFPMFNWYPLELKIVVFPVPPVLRAATAAVVPKLRESIGALVIISVPADVPPILPVRLVRVRLPVEVLVLIVLDEDVKILPEPVDRVTDCIVVLPRLELT